MVPGSRQATQGTYNVYLTNSINIIIMKQRYCSLERVAVIVKVSDNQGIASDLMRFPQSIV